MPLQSSGAISISQIASALGMSSSTSLRNLSSQALKSSPDSFSEFYGYPANPSTTDLVVYLDAGNSSSYPGTGTTWTNLGSGANFSIINGAAYSSTTGGRFTFDGVNDYARASISRSTTLQSRTLEVAFMCTGADSTDQGVFCIQGGSGGTNDGQTFFRLSPAGTTLNMIQVFGNPTVAKTISYSINLNQIYYAQFTEDHLGDYQGTLYVNGVQVGTSDLSGVGNYLYSSTYTFVGVSKTSLSRYFNGHIYCALQYNRVLTSTELRNNYNFFKARLGL